ncbi:hypothetical protein BJ165DRAFT_1403444 [Panaeolus papilionaceus]|nr:hypothetical protein BJ165DRAFT_1403444 [Panaeolus papilionaceus]
MQAIKGVVSFFNPTSGGSGRITRSKESIPVSQSGTKNPVLRKAPPHKQPLGDDTRPSTSSTDQDSFSDIDVVAIDQPMTSSCESFDDLSVAHQSAESIPRIPTPAEQQPAQDPQPATPVDEEVTPEGGETSPEKRKSTKPHGQLATLRKEKAASEAKGRDLGAKIRKLEERACETRKQLAKLTTEKDIAWRSNNDSMRELEREWRNRETYQKAFERLDDQNQRLKSQNKELQNMSQHLKQRMVEQQSVAQKQQIQLQELLDVRTKDLNHAQAFLTLTDKYSGYDVKKMVEALNTEIFQTAACLADLVESSRPPKGAYSCGWEECLPTDAIEPLASVIGDRLMSIIATRGLRMCDDTLPLQLALQACLVQWSLCLVDVFGGEKQLHVLYNQIKETGSSFSSLDVMRCLTRNFPETQVVAARWRVMTSNNVAKRALSTPNAKRDLFQAILGLLKMGGWSRFDSEGISAVNNSLGEIETLATKIKVAIGEYIMSCDMRLIASSPGDSFTQVSMENNYPNGRRVQSRDLIGQEILCSLGLGLAKATNMSTDSGRYHSRDEILLKNKVALASIAFNMGD